MSVLSEVGPFGGHFFIRTGDNMNEEMWKRREISLKGKITRLRNKSQKAERLQKKIELQRKEKQARDELHQHRLNYFELTAKSM